MCKFESSKSIDDNQSLQWDYQTWRSSFRHKQHLKPTVFLHLTFICNFWRWNALGQRTVLSFSMAHSVSFPDIVPEEGRIKIVQVQEGPDLKGVTVQDFGQQPHTYCNRFPYPRILYKRGTKWKVYNGIWKFISTMWIIKYTLMWWMR